MIPTTFKFIKNNIHSNTLNVPNINSKATLLISRNFAKKQLMSYTDEQIAIQIKMIKSSDLVCENDIGTFKEQQQRDNLLKTAIDLRNSLKNKDVERVQSIYKHTQYEENSHYAVGQKSHLFSEIFSSVVGSDAKSYRNIYGFSSKGLSELIKTRNDSTKNVVFPPTASLTDANSWKHSLEGVEAKKHASKKNLGDSFKAVLSQDKPNSDFHKNEIKDSNQVGETPQFASDVVYIYTDKSGSTRVNKDYKKTMSHKTEQSDHESHEISCVGNTSNDDIQKMNDANCNKHLNTIELKRKFNNLTKEESDFYDKAEYIIKKFQIDQKEEYLNELDKMGYPFRQFLNHDELVD